MWNIIPKEESDARRREWLSTLILLIWYFPKFLTTCPPAKLLEHWGFPTVASCWSNATASAMLSHLKQRQKLMGPFTMLKSHSPPSFLGNNFQAPFTLQWYTKNNDWQPDFARHPPHQFCQTQDLGHVLPLVGGLHKTETITTDMETWEN